MKKMFSIILALVLVLSLGGAVFATQPDTSKTIMDGQIPKSLTLANTDGLNPAEDFTFTFTQQPATTNTNLAVVAIPNVTISYDADDVGTKNGEINLAAFSASDPLVPVGRYTYSVAETLPDPLTAGMTYTTRTGTLVVDKESDGTVKSYLIIGTVGTDLSLKYDEFDNMFSAGDLTIKKVVTGNLGDKTKLFNVTVTLTAPTGKIVKDDLIKLVDPAAVETAVDFTDGANNTAEVTFQVKDGDTFTITNLPYGVTYAVEETAPGEGYSVTYAGDTGTIEESTQEATITNHKSSEIPTGISLDSLPYILLIIGAVVGISILLLKKRRNADI